MLFYIKQKFHEILPDSLFALLITPYLNLQREQSKFILIRYKKYWKIKWKKSELYVPSPKRIMLYSEGLEARFNRLIKKYSYHPYVEVKKGDVVCDVGAYIGEFSLAISNKADKIYAFEPDPIASTCLQRNVNKLEKINIYQNILWKCNTNLEFTLAYETADSSIFKPVSGREKSKIKMVANRLDDLLTSLNVNKVDFLKIDAEGG